MDRDLNCLSYALQFWNKNPDYKIWYNSDHCINIPIDTYPSFKHGRMFLPAEEFGYYYFSNAFKDLISEEDHILLKEYFGILE